MFYFLYLEDFNIKSKIIIFCLIICLLIPLGAASASDVNNTDDQVLSATPNTDTLSAGVNLEQENDTLSVQNENILSAGQDSGSNNLLGDDGENTLTISDLVDYISLSSGEITLNSNYTYNSTTDRAYKDGITISKEIKINGNNITINGQGMTSLFIVNANNVVIDNIKMKNFQAYSVNRGVIVWNGNNGILSNIQINNSYKRQYSSHGDAQGTILWVGQDGTINNLEICNLKSPTSVSNVIYVEALNLKMNHIKFESISFSTGIYLAQDSNGTKIKDLSIKDTQSSTIISSRRGGVSVDTLNITDLKCSNCFALRVGDTIKNAEINKVTFTNYLVSDGCFNFDNVIVKDSKFNNIPFNNVYLGSKVNGFKFINNTVSSNFANAPFIINNSHFENNTFSKALFNSLNNMEVHNTNFTNIVYYEKFIPMK